MSLLQSVAKIAGNFCLKIKRRYRQAASGRQRSADIVRPTADANCRVESERTIASPSTSSTNMPIMVVSASIADYERVLPYLTKAGFLPIVVFKDDTQHTQEVWPAIMSGAIEAGAGAPVRRLSELEFFCQEDRYRSIPIVVADAGDGAAFSSIGPRIAGQISNEQQLLHPAFLADYVVHDLSQNVITYGFPGSGNVVVQKIMSRLLAQQRANRYDLLESWCASGHSILVEAMRNKFRELNATQFEIGYAQPGYLTASASFYSQPEKRLYFPAIPSQIYVADVVYGTHSLPITNELQRIVAHGGRIVLVSRHPLDIMVSMAAKHSASHVDAYIQQTGKSYSEARAFLIAQQMRDDNAFWATLLNQRAYLRAATELAVPAKVLRYEDLMESPEEVIRQIAEFLGVPVTAEFVEELSCLVGNVQLGPEHHVFTPGVQKWESMLPPDRVMSVVLSGIFNDAKQFGYSTDITADSPSENAKQTETIKISPFSHMYYLGDDEVRRRMKIHDTFAHVAGIEVTSEDQDYISRWRSGVEKDPWMRQVMSSMSLRA